MYPNFEDLEYFLAIAKHKSVTNASLDCGVHQSTMSVALTRLEKVLGLKLTMRVKGGIELTHAGNRFALESQQILDDWQTRKSKVLEDEKRITGTFTLCTNPSAGIIVLPKILPQLNKQYPDLNIRIQTNSQGSNLGMVQTGQANFCLTAATHMPEGVKKIGLETTEIGLWAAKNAPMRPIDSTLYFDPKVIGFSELKKKLDRRKIRFAKTSLVDDMELIAAIVSSGVGIGLLATQTAKKQRNLRRLFPQDITYKAQINLAYRPDNTSSSGAQAVIAEFRKVPK